MKLIAVDQTPEKIVLIYSDPKTGELVSHEFDLNDSDLEEKLRPHMSQELLQRHLKRHPLKPGKKEKEVEG